MKNYIKLTEENYFKSLELGLIPMDWIKRQVTAGSDIFNNSNKVITYDGKILDFRNYYNVLNDNYREVSSVSELSCIKYKIYDEYDSNKYIEEKETFIEAKGGDGTLIRAIHKFKDSNKPFFGIAAGTENFLMNPESVIKNNHEKLKLHLIEVEVYHQKPIYNLRGHVEDYEEVVSKTYAFNDVIIGEFNAWIEFNCKHEDDILGNFMGAGLLISTAQGSTGANKNNNGTILPLSSKNWSVTGVQVNRNINYVIESTSLEINCTSRGNIKINVDGKHFEADGVSRVVLKKGPIVEVIFNDILKFKKKRQQN